MCVCVGVGGGKRLHRIALQGISSIIMDYLKINYINGYIDIGY